MDGDPDHRHPAPRDAERLRANPLGIYVNAISWSREMSQLPQRTVISACRFSAHPQLAALLLSATMLAGCATNRTPADQL